MGVATATFKIDGRHITRLARNLVVDGDWRDGLNLLVDSFEGMENEHAFKILAGTHTLDGINDDITMIEELDEEYRNDVRDVYCSDKFYEKNQLYTFVKFIDHRAIDEEIKRREQSYAIPACDEYVRKYLLPDDMVVFETSSKGKRYRGLIAQEANSNTLPLWLRKDDFCNSAKIYANEHYPEKVFVREEVPKLTIVEKDPIKTETQTSDTNDWHDSFRGILAELKAKDHGFDNVIDFSNHLRVAVLDAIKERNGNWKTLAIKEEGVNETISYPYELALAYSLSRTGLSKLAPAWMTVSPGSLKMENDSQLHTDFWLSLGFNLDGREYNYTTREYTLFSAVVRTMQREVFPMGEFDTLNSAGLDSFSGTVVTSHSEHIHRNSILVISTAGPEYDVIARKAGLVICETGSRMAHLVVVGREFGLPLVRIEGACEKFKEGITLNIDFKTNTLTASS